MDPKLAAKLNSRKEASEGGVDSFEVPRTAVSGDVPTAELNSKLNRRLDYSEKEPSAFGDVPQFKIFNPYTEFKEFSRKDIKSLESNFKKYDQDHDSFLGFNDLKYMMEKLGVPQTHLALKQMIKEIDEDHDNQISFREFMLIFRKARAGEFDKNNPLLDLYEKYVQLESIAVEEVGVKGAKSFFEAKVAKITKDQSMANEILMEQEEKRAKEEEAKIRREEFRLKQASFQK